MSEATANFWLNEAARLKIEEHDLLEATIIMRFSDRQYRRAEARTLHIQQFAEAAIAASAKRLPDFRDNQRSDYDRSFQDMRVGGDD